MMETSEYLKFFNWAMKRADYESLRKISTSPHIYEKLRKTVVREKNQRSRNEMWCGYIKIIPISLRELNSYELPLNIYWYVPEGRKAKISSSQEKYGTMDYLRHTYPDHRLHIGRKFIKHERVFIDMEGHLLHGASGFISRELPDGTYQVKTENHSLTLSAHEMSHPELFRL